MKNEKTPIPRKPLASKKTTSFFIRLTESQAEALRKNAEAEELTRTDYVIKRCCE